MPPAEPTRLEWTPAAADAIRRKARQLVGKAGLKPQDVPDLEQELALDLLTRASAYNRRRQPDPDAFVRMVVCRAAAKLLRDRRAAKRDPARVGSLDRHEVAAPEAGDGSLVWDVAEARAGLPAELAVIARHLGDEPLAAVAARIGIPRTTLYSRLETIRQHFAARGLG